MLIPQQLTKEEEASASAEDMEVRREDQEKINRFSSLHQKETSLEEELRAKIVSAAPRPLLFFLLHLANPAECRISLLHTVCEGSTAKLATLMVC